MCTGVLAYFSLLSSVSNSFSPQILSQSIKVITIIPECKRVSLEGRAEEKEEEEAGLWLMLSGEVEQPLAQ